MRPSITAPWSCLSGSESAQPKINEKNTVRSASTDKTYDPYTLAVLAKAEKYENQIGSQEPVKADIVMPGMDGLALAKELLDVYPRLPIMIMTGHSKADTAKSVRLAGVPDFIMKSFSIDEFIRRFNRMMHNPMT